MNGARTWAVVGILFVAALLTVIYLVGAERYEDGRTAERSAWLSRENTELDAANARIVKLEADARKARQDHAEGLAKASTNYQESLQHEKASHDRTVADLRTGTLRLRIELARRQTTAGDRAGAAAPAAAGCDGETRAELSAAASEFLVGLASEADAVVHQLTACQAVVTADHATREQ